MRDQGDQRQLGILLTYLSSAYTLREDSMVIAYNVIDFDYFLGLILELPRLLCF